ncbi:hypothetical protein WAI453_002641 [Rhynchosporium graminicola]
MWNSHALPLPPRQLFSDERKRLKQNLFHSSIKDEISSKIVAILPETIEVFGLHYKWDLATLRLNLLTIISEMYFFNLLIREKVLPSTVPMAISS